MSAVINAGLQEFASYGSTSLQRLDSFADQLSCKQAIDNNIKM